MRLIAAEVDRSAVERAREFELEEARNLQRAIVPSEPLHAGPVEIASRYHPVAGVGGDFLDYFLLPDWTLGLYLGDVVGKGLPAALYAALVVGTLRGIPKTGEPPANVLTLLNRRLHMRVMPGRFCAVQYAVFDPVTRVLSYANAGLPGPVRISARGCRELHDGGVPVGLFPDKSYDLHRVELDPGDTVLFLTDGLTEAQNRDAEEFGMERVFQICCQRRGEPAEALLQRLFAAVERFVGGHPQYDDMTAAALKLETSGP